MANVKSESSNIGKKQIRQQMGVPKIAGGFLCKSINNFLSKSQKLFSNYAIECQKSNHHNAIFHSVQKQTKTNFKTFQKDNIKTKKIGCHKIVFAI